MADQIFEIKFHNLFGYKFGRIVDEAHNLYNGDEGWATKDEVKAFMDKYLEALNKEHLRRVNIQKYKRCLLYAKNHKNLGDLATDAARLIGLNAYAFTKETETACIAYWNRIGDCHYRHHNEFLELAKKFKEGK